MAMPSLPRLSHAAATEVMFRASTRRSGSSRRPARTGGQPGRADRPAQLVLRSSRAASRPVIFRSLSTVWLTSGGAP